MKIAGTKEGKAAECAALFRPCLLSEITLAERAGVEGWMAMSQTGEIAILVGVSRLA
jgi:hypothetical protein